MKVILKNVHWVILITTATLITAILLMLFLFNQGKVQSLTRLQEIKGTGDADLYYHLLAQMSVEHPDWDELDPLLAAEAITRAQRVEAEAKWRETLERHFLELDTQVKDLGTRTTWLETNLASLSRKLGLIYSRPVTDNLGWLENQNPLGSTERMVVKNQEISDVNKLFYLGELAQAKNLIQQGLKKDPENPYLLILGAGIFFFENPQDEARRKKALEIVNAKVPKVKEFPGAYFTLGSIALVAGDSRDGVRNLTQAWNLDSGNYRISLELGRALVAFGDSAGAQRPLMAAWKTGVSPSVVAPLLIKVFKVTGEVSKLSELLVEWTQRESQSAQAWQSLGEHLFDAKNWKDSISALSKALAIKENARLCFKVAQAYDQVSDSAKAALYYQRTVEILDLAKDKDILAYAVEGTFQNLDRNQDWRGLVLFSKEIIRRNLDFPQAGYYLGKALVQSGDSSGGASYLEKVGQVPWISQAKRILIQVYYQKKDWAKFEALTSSILATEKSGDLRLEAEKYMAMRDAEAKK